MDIQLLGAVELRDEDGATVRLKRSAERCVLATLAFSPGRQVKISTLIDNIGPTRNGTDTTATTLNGYVRKIREAITKAGGSGKCLRTMTQSRSYLLEVAADTIDYYKVTAQVTAAHAAGDIEALQRALDAWPAGALADINNQWAHNRRYALEGEYLEFYEALLEHRLRAGQHLLVARKVTELIDQTILSENLLLLGVQGLAGAGRAASIPDWVTRTSRRMRERAEAELSPAFYKAVDTLMADTVSVLSSAEKRSQMGHLVAAPDWSPASLAKQASRPIIVVAPDVISDELFEPPLVLPEPCAPSMLLRAAYGIVPFARRSTEMANLHAWATAPPSVAVQLITGPGGQGKTRLADHFQQQLRAQGWFTGTVKHDVDPNIISCLTEVSSPALLVVDYAEGRTAQLHALAAALANRTGPPARLLLLARAAGDWLRELRAHTDDHIATLWSTLTTQRLASLAPRVTDRHSEFHRAIDVFAKKLGHDPGSVEVPVELDEQRNERALDIHAAALADVMDSAADSGVGYGDPIERVLHHEYRYWRRTSKDLPGVDPVRLDSVMAAATLFGAPTRESARQLLGSLPAFVDEKPHLVDRYQQWAHTLNPGAQALQPLQPDRLGEEHAAYTLSSQPEIALRPAVDVSDAQIVQLLTVLGRAAPRHDHLHSVLNDVLVLAPARSMAFAVEIATQIEEPAPLVHALTNLLDSLDPEQIDTLTTQLPSGSVALGEFAATVTERALRSTRQRARLRDPELKAKMLMGLAGRLRVVGRYDEGLSADLEAVGIWRELAVQRQGDFEAGLGCALESLSVSLGLSGRQEEGVVASLEAVAIWRETVSRLPNVAHPGIKGLVGFYRVYCAAAARLPEPNLPDIVNLLGQYWALWELGAQAADVNRLGLARSLQALSENLSSAHRYEEALSSLGEAIEIRRNLALALMPAAFQADLASLLSNLANKLGKLRRNEEAISAAFEAVKIRRDLAAESPDSYLPELALALQSLSARLGALGRDEEALSAVVEAVDIQRSLAARQPGSYSADLALSLNNLARRLGALGRSGEALSAVVEAVDIRRSLAARQPGSYSADLALSLNNLAHWLGALGRSGEALSAVIEAIGIQRCLLVEGLIVHRSDLATSLNNLAKWLRVERRYDEALSAGVEAVGIWRDLDSLQPDVHQSDLGHSLSDLVVLLHEMGRQEEASSAVFETVAIQRGLVAQVSVVHRPGLATSLDNLAQWLHVEQRYEEAASASFEAIEIWRDLDSLRPGARRRELAISLHKLVKLLNDAGRYEELLTGFLELVDLYRKMFYEDCTVGGRDLAVILLGKTLLFEDDSLWEKLSTLAEIMNLCLKFDLDQQKCEATDILRKLYADSQSEVCNIWRGIEPNIDLPFWK